MFHRQRVEFDEENEDVCVDEEREGTVSVFYAEPDERERTSGVRGVCD